MKAYAPEKTTMHESLFLPDCPAHIILNIRGPSLRGLLIGCRFQQQTGEELAGRVPARSLQFPFQSRGSTFHPLKSSSVKRCTPPPPPTPLSLWLSVALRLKLCSQICLCLSLLLASCWLFTLFFSGGRVSPKLIQFQISTELTFKPIRRNRCFFLVST